MDLTWLGELWASGQRNAFVTIVLTMILAGMISLGFRQVLATLAARTETDLDDVLVRVLRVPISVSVALLGLWYAISLLELTAAAAWMARGVFTTLGALIWGFTGTRLIREGLDWLLSHRDRYRSIINPRTEPIFDVAGKTFVYGATVYFLFLAWEVDLTGWLASAGVIGIAVGFASQDTLANLVAGIFILTDGPYKIGDYLVLETGERGRVTEIGMRTTRILTNDDVEIILPNRAMANSRIVNESGGPAESFRTRIQVRAAYGSDIDQVRQVLQEVARACPGVLEQPAPQVWLVEFGEFSLEFTLLVWIDVPRIAERVRDDLFTGVYKAFQEHGILIPLPQRDVRLLPKD